MKGKHAMAIRERRRPREDDWGIGDLACALVIAAVVGPSPQVVFPMVYVVHHIIYRARLAAWLWRSGGSDGSQAGRP